MQVSACDSQTDFYFYCRLGDVREGGSLLGGIVKRLKEFFQGIVFL